MIRINMNQLDVVYISLLKRSMCAGSREWDCLDLFSFTKRIMKTWVSRGHSAVAFDIKSDSREDVTVRSGFERLLVYGLGFLDCRSWVYEMPITGVVKV